ncbi:hypothetical protein L208DRAFT_1459814 [Tricholoma matsutake]|nr:hypothetical protein L208DRAFT_1459814 [Tricholoma matsutake 945]
MDDSSAQSDSPPFSLLATSILGIKGPLRLRPHGSTQKPHIVLRRVTISEDSNEDGEASNVVRFSVFAAKRIEVKPGKEILLTVASPDGCFKDQAVIFEADLTVSEEIPYETSDTQVAEEQEVYLPPAGEAIPPKMRRAWTKKVEEVGSVTQPAVTHSSVGVQAQPVYVSMSTQAQSACTHISAQTYTDCVSTSVQFDPELLPHNSSSVQTEDDRRYTNLDVQTDVCTVDHDSWDQPYLTTRKSLSPMDLGNSPYSEGYRSPQYWSPPGHRGSHSPNQWAANSPPYTQPVDTPTWSPSYLPYRASTPSQCSTPEKPDHVLEGSADASAAGDCVHPPSPMPVASTTATDLNARSRSGESQYSNKFVSAGMLFACGSSDDEKSALRQTNTSGERAGDVTSSPCTVTPKSSTSVTSGPILLAPSAPIPTESLSPSSQASNTISVKSLHTSQNAVASSSKVLLNTITPLAQQPPQQSTVVNGTRRVAGLSSRALEKSPASQIHANAKRPSSLLNAIAYIPFGPSSNPLNIKPSSCATPRVASPPRALRALSQKRVVVGTGWPSVKAINAISNPANPPSPAQPPPSLPPAGSFHTVKTTDLSSIISYSSPSPSPSTPTTMSVVSKWKRVSNAPLAGAAITSGASCTPQPAPIVSDDQQKSNKPVTSEGLQTGPPMVRVSKKPCVSLKDRIGPATSPSESQSEESMKTITDGPERNLSSRIFDVPTPSQPPMVSTEDRLRKVPDNTPISQPMLRSPAATVSQPLVHPLPPKPVLAVNTTVLSRGVKRELPTTPTTDLTRPRRRNLKWPTVDCNHFIGLKGDGELAIRSISFSSDGGHFALNLADRSIRIWNNYDRAEIAKLMHNCPVVSVLWMDDDSGIISLGKDGLVSKWTRDGINRWQWAKVLDAGNDHLLDDDQICFAYHRDRIAVSFPRTGVKVWMRVKGTWQQHRGILRQNVSSLRFVEDGEALLGGTRDGVLWYCEVPNGTLRAYAFLKAKITSLDLNPAGTHVLVSQIGGSARLLNIRQADKKGSVELSYSCKETEAHPDGGFGAVFATQGQAVLFGSVEGCVLVWDRKKGAIVYGLAHEEGDIIQAVASFDGALNREGCLLTGTSRGHLAWWSQPLSSPNGDSNVYKRARTMK